MNEAFPRICVDIHPCTDNCGEADAGRSLQGFSTIVCFGIANAFDICEELCYDNAYEAE